MPLTKGSFFGLILIGLLVSGALVAQLTHLSGEARLADLRAVGEERLNLYASTLRGALEKFRYLPYVLGHNEKVVALLSGAEASDGVNAYLEALNKKAGSAQLFVMNRDGETVAASNWRAPLSFVGKNYSFRPYFREAADGHQGRLFAIGVTTGEPGYFMSHPVLTKGEVIGVAVVKVDLDRLQIDWREGGEIVFVSDSNGVLILSGREVWKYRTLRPLSDAQREQVRSGRLYGGQELLPLPFIDQVDLTPLVHRLTIGDRDYLLLDRPLAEPGWHLHFLTPLTPVEERAFATAVFGLVTILLMIAVSLYLRERHHKRMSRRKVREAEATRALNLRLEAEIAERKRTEQDLRDAQEELVQAGKLAALGEMSAGIVHELSQPISATRTFLSSVQLLAKRGESDKAMETLERVFGLIDRMTAITTQLKTFARKNPVKRQPVVLQQSVRKALELLEGRVSRGGVSLAVNLPPEPLVVLADPLRIEQVVVNLTGNALDALAQSPSKRIDIVVREQDGLAELTVRDSGGGIDPEHLGKLFDPFFTTKDVGEGMGLGLSISYGIISDVGGTIRVAETSSDGTALVVRLPLHHSEEA
ncbi:ATP-binding protein [Magnetospira sp. QH-2]|uniref:sensor histidine kinase n=1 Tax=Magnetospira sp. (strain QH-2) TaxID=1288970 RepID=UPI0003E80CF8|nr:ATP-binding protein [Magnetospira sp. QH-2]CCQ73177.1 Signal transduction histidine kinase [Magnetospira sp. QH-2]